MGETGAVGVDELRPQLCIGLLVGGANFHGTATILVESPLDYVDMMGADIRSPAAAKLPRFSPIRKKRMNTAR